MCCGLCPAPVQRSPLGRAVSGPDRAICQRLLPHLLRGRAHPVHGEQLCKKRHPEPPGQKEVHPGADRLADVYRGLQDSAVHGEHRHPVPDAAGQLLGPGRL